MGLDEAHPRGQFNAFLAAAEAGGPGRWARLSSAAMDSCPQVVDVDFPRLAMRRAEWIDGSLHLALAPLVEDPAGRSAFRVTGVGPGSWRLTGIDGATLETTDDGLIVEVPLAATEVELAPA